jgi:hypothetical protein
MIWKLSITWSTMSLLQVRTLVVFIATREQGSEQSDPQQFQRLPPPRVIEEEVGEDVAAVRSFLRTTPSTGEGYPRFVPSGRRGPFCFQASRTQMPNSTRLKRIHSQSSMVETSHSNDAPA